MHATEPGSLTVTTGPAIDIYVELDSSLPVADWSQRHAADLVPDEMPYGLDLLSAYGIRPHFRRQTERGRFAGRAADAVRHRAGGWDWVETVRSSRDSSRRRVDAFICWDERTGIPEALLGRRRGRPLLMGMSWLADAADSSGLRRAAKRGLSSVDVLFAHTHRSLELMAELFDVPDERLRYLPLGIDETFFRPASAPPDPSHGIVISSVGDDRDRDHPLLIDAVRQVQDVHPDVRLNLATTLPVDMGPAVGTLQSRRLGPAVRALYADSHVVAVATRPNAFGSGLSVALEAAASGRPLVITDNPGISEYVTPETGVLVPPNDAAAFASALNTLVADPERCLAMGRAARAHIERHHTSRIQAAHLADIIREATDR